MGRAVMVQVDLSFVVPAYNEEESIETALLEIDGVIKNRNLPYEIVVVNDGSKDNTYLKAKLYASKNGHVRVISYDQNVGKGYAIKKGFMETSGQVVVFVDSDMDIDIGTIQSYIDALKYGDIVVATKWHKDSQIQMPIKRRILSHGFNVLVRAVIGAELKDTQVGLKAMRKTAFNQIFPRLCVKRYAFDVELLAVANLYGLKIVEMPTKLRIDGMFNIREVFKMFVDLLGIAYRLKIIHWYQRPINI
jgi:glycosyltransferase involved in cell wall biosynthesis